MRIRKRQVPLPLSSLSPVPLSDPLFHNLNYSPPPPMVQLPTHHHDDPSPTLPKPSNPVEKTPHVGHPPPRPSDHHQLNQHLSPIGPRAGKARGSSDAGLANDNHKEPIKEFDLEVLLLKGEEDEKSNDDIREEAILGAETLIGFALGSSSSSHRGVGRWCEGEKAFPLKKRRGSFGRGAKQETIMDDQKDKKSMKTKTNKKCATQLKNDDQKEDDRGETKQAGLQHANSVDNNASAVRKRGRGGALMEGSRCSRVNGRGWRCCQQTLVGYSLCEHHLGKGRLRSMNSVRSRSMATTTATTTATTSPASAETQVKRLSASRPSLESTHEENAKAAVVLDDYDVSEDKGDHGEDEGEEEEEEKPLIVTKKRKKLGVVKARSMSSLLGQTNSAIAAVADDDNS